MDVIYHQQYPTLRLLLVLKKMMDHLRHNLGIRHQHKPYLVISVQQD
jgi:hypothetical protein